jgi:uncharacterized membrane protein YhaH (DUF805 family)
MAKFFSQFPRSAEGHEVLEATEARQGRWGRHAFWVLVISTTLAVVALFASWAFHAPKLGVASEASTPTAAEARATTGPETTVKE